MSSAAPRFVCMGPIQSLGLGETVPIPGCDPPVDHLLSTTNLSISPGQSAERSGAPATQANTRASIGKTTRDAGDAAAEAEPRHAA